VDAAAHEAAVKNDLPTVGVLGNGLETVYPTAHWPLARKVVGKGGLLSSLAYGVKAERYSFPIRNRLVAGMCDALVVVQTGVDGGSMNAVRNALKFGKKV